MIYVDANYWIYWFDERLPEHRFVREAMRAAIREGIVMNVITVLEIAHYLRLLPEHEFRKRMDYLMRLSTLTLIPLDVDLLNTALGMLIKYARLGIGSRDSVILATMEKAGVNRILTHDKTFRKIEWLEVVDVIPQE